MVQDFIDDHPGTETGDCTEDEDNEQAGEAHGRAQWAVPGHGILTGALRHSSRTAHRFTGLEDMPYFRKRTLPSAKAKLIRRLQSAAVLVSVLVHLLDIIAGLSLAEVHVDVEDPVFFSPNVMVSEGWGIAVSASRPASAIS